MFLRNIVPTISTYDSFRPNLQYSTIPMSTSLSILLRFVANAAVIWALSTHMSQYLTVTGDLRGYITIGALLTLLNMFLRPILGIITLPLKLFAGLLTSILVQLVLLYIVNSLSARMDAEIVTFTIGSGLWGWLVVGVILGVVNRIFK